MTSSPAAGGVLETPTHEEVWAQPLQPHVQAQPQQSRQGSEAAGSSLSSKSPTAPQRLPNGHSAGHSNGFLRNRQTSGSIPVRIISSGPNVSMPRQALIPPSSVAAGTARPSGRPFTQGMAPRPKTRPAARTSSAVGPSRASSGEISAASDPPAIGTPAADPAASSPLLPIYLAHAPRPKSLILASRAPVIRKACDLCHTARRKCSGERPKCASCRQKGTECHYPIRLHRKNSKARQEQERLVRALHGDGGQSTAGGSPLANHVEEQEQHEDVEHVEATPIPSQDASLLSSSGSPARKRARTAAADRPKGLAAEELVDPAWAAVDEHDAAIWSAEDYLAMIDQDGHCDGLDLRTHADVLSPKPLKPPKRTDEASRLAQDANETYLSLFAPPPPTATRSPSRDSPVSTYPTTQPRFDLADFDPVAIFGGVLGDDAGAGDDSEISAEALQNALITAQLTSFQLELEQQQQQEAEQQQQQTESNQAAAAALGHVDAFAEYTHHHHHDEGGEHADMSGIDDEHAAELHAIMDGLAAASSASASGSIAAADDDGMELEDEADFMLEPSVPPVICPQLVEVMRSLEAYRSLPDSPALGELFPPLTSALTSIQHFASCESCSTAPAWTLPQLALTSRTCTLLAGKHPLTPAPLELSIAGGRTAGTGLPPEIEVHVVDIVWATWRGATVQKALTRLQILAMAENARIKDQGEQDEMSPVVLRGQTMLKGLARLQKYMATHL